jgi:hypothetical protein
VPLTNKSNQIPIHEKQIIHHRCLRRRLRLLHTPGCFGGHQEITVTQSEPNGSGSAQNESHPGS